MVRRAIELLQYNTSGYLLVVDAGLMRKAAQENNAERTFRQTIELDRAVAVARNYAGPKSTVIVCGDVAIGGLSLNGLPFRQDSGIALLGFNAAGQPWITWATGPNGTKSYGAAKIPGNLNGNGNEQPDVEPREPAAVYTKAALGTVQDVIAFGSGPGTDVLRGVLDNTTIFEIIRGCNGLCGERRLLACCRRQLADDIPSVVTTRGIERSKNFSVGCRKGEAGSLYSPGNEPWHMPAFGRVLIAGYSSPASLRDRLVSAGYRDTRVVGQDPSWSRSTGNFPELILRITPDWVRCLW